MSKTATLAEAIQAANALSPVRKIPKIDIDKFIQDPLQYYKQAIKKVYSQSEFDTADEYEAIILNVTTYSYVNIHHIDELISLKDNVLSNTVQTMFQQAVSNKEKFKFNFYNICIPQIDKSVPLPEDWDDKTNIVKTFYSTSDRLAFSFNKGLSNLRPGAVVRVKGVLKSQENKLPCIITEILDAKPIQLEIAFQETSKDVFEKCVRAPFAPKEPENQVNSTPTPPPNTPGSDLIYSSKSEKPSPYINFNFTSNQSAATISSVLTKEKEVKKVSFGIEKVLPICVNPIANPNPPVNGNEPSPSLRAFLKDGSRSDAKTQINVSNFILDKLTEDEEINSYAPILIVPPDTRDISTIIIKEAPYLNIEDYKKYVSSNKQYAAHFCIDNTGSIYQFTDTCNIVKSYNPTINETAIQIAVLNISYANSRRTVNSIGSGPPGLNINLPLNLITSMLADEQSLKSFYRKNGIQKRNVQSEYLKFKDRNIFPNYRLDIQEEQKTSLKNLINAIINTYSNLKLTRESIPELTLDPQIIAGNFVGVICPYNFSLDTNGVFNIKQILGIN